MIKYGVANIGSHTNCQKEIEIVVTLFRIKIALRHRNRVEIRKFEHIMNCEKALGLHTEYLISGVKPTQPISVWDAFLP